MQDYKPKISSVIQSSFNMNNLQLWNRHVNRNRKPFQLVNILMVYSWVVMYCGYWYSSTQNGGSYDLGNPHKIILVPTCNTNLHTTFTWFRNASCKRCKALIYAHLYVGSVGKQDNTSQKYISLGNQKCLTEDESLKWLF